MASVRDNATRVKRFRELKATLRTNRQRLLVGLDIAQAEHVVHLRHAHTRVVVPTLTIPNTTRGFTQLWARIQQAQRATGCREVVCGLEPTGTYHEAVAALPRRRRGRTWSWSPAAWPTGTAGPRTGPGTSTTGRMRPTAPISWSRGRSSSTSQPDGPLAELRRLVKCLRRARAELAACKARWRTTLRPALGPMGEPLPNRLGPSCRPCCKPGSRRPPGARRCRRGASRSGWPRPVPISGPRSRPCRPGSRRLRRALHAPRRAAPGVRAPPDDPGDRAHGGRDPPGGDRRHRVVHAVQPAPEARGPRHRPGAVGAVRGAGADLEVRPRAPALGALPRGDGAGADRRGAGPARGPEGEAAGRSVRRLQGDRGAGGEGAPDRLGRVAERDPVRPAAHGGLRRQPR